MNADDLQSTALDALTDAEPSNGNSTMTRDERLKLLKERHAKSGLSGSVLGDGPFIPTPSDLAVMKAYIAYQDRIRARIFMAKIEARLKGGAS